jgi:Tol biopolymer transport system component
VGPAALFGNPTWSPDESRVLFHFGEPGDPSLYVVKADGSEPAVKLVDGSGLSADWSPDSQRIVYEFGDYIYTVAADGSEPPRRLVPARKPDWSPDGSRVAVEVGSFPNFEVWLIDPETGQGIKLVDGGLAYHTAGSVWSPDGSLLLYQVEGSLYALAPEVNGPPTKLGEVDGIMSWPDIDPVWSPDGSRVAFRRIVGEAENIAGVYQVLVVSAGGSGLTLVAEDLVPACVAYDWSPDSQRIAFSSTWCPLI